MPVNILPDFPNQLTDQHVDTICLVSGDVADIHIEARSPVRVFIYKLVSEDPLITVGKS